MELEFKISEYCRFWNEFTIESHHMQQISNNTRYLSSEAFPQPLVIHLVAYLTIPNQYPYIHDSLVKILIPSKFHNDTQ